VPEIRIPLTRPWLDEQEAAAARRAILSGWVTQGPEVEAFEREFAATVGAPHACAVSSGTAALHVALLAVGVRPGDEVITVSYSYIATANAVRHAGAVPVFVDVAPGSPNIDPSQVREALTARTRAILAVHQMGMPCDLAALAEIARQSGIPLVEDAACAAGSEMSTPDGCQPIGAPRGDVACFSFHPRKLITTGDGGMVTCRRGELDARFRLLRQHGMNVSARTRHASAQPLAEEHVVLGYNYRMTDVQAAIGRVQLTRLPQMVERRRVLADRYRSSLAGRGVDVPRVPEWARPNWQTFWVELPDSCDRNGVISQMRAAGIATKRGIQCAHREPAYRVEPWRAGAAGLPESERLERSALILPLYPQMTDAEQEEVVDRLTAIVAGVTTA
jgi:perosamine synthetase